VASVVVYAWQHTLLLLRLPSPLLAPLPLRIENSCVLCALLDRLQTGADGSPVLAASVMPQ
jgi:hypothetical protein